jgi:hypothetical protein
MRLCNVHVIAQFVGAGGQEERNVKTVLSYTVGYQYDIPSFAVLSWDTKEGKADQQNQNTSLR